MLTTIFISFVLIIWDSSYSCAASGMEFSGQMGKLFGVAVVFIVVSWALKQLLPKPKDRPFPRMDAKAERECKLLLQQKGYVLIKPYKWRVKKLQERTLQFPLLKN